MAKADRRPARLRRFPLAAALGLVVAYLLGAAGCAPLQAVVPVASEPAPAAPPVIPTPTPIPPPAPQDLGQEAPDGQAIVAGGWATRSIILTFRAPEPAGAWVPEVEVVRVGEPFRGVPTTRGEPLPAGAGAARVELPDLAPGRYRWQARFRDGESEREGAWVAFAEGEDGFGVAGRPPAVQRVVTTGALVSPEGEPFVGQSGRLGLRWTVAVEPPAELDRLAYLLHPRDGVPNPADARSLPPTARSLDLEGLPDGQWYLHLWAVDEAGQAGEPATIPLTVLRSPPEIREVSYRTFVTNPLYQQASIRFKLSRPASVAVTIFARSSPAPVRVYHLARQAADETVSVAWDGRDSRLQVVEPGPYSFVVEATDDAGNTAQARHDGLTITDKLIRVSLGSQSMVAYAGATAVLSTLVTTGGQQLPTRPGTFEVEYKRSPFTFHSPFPRSSRFWYPDATVRYAMLFDPAEGNFIHDNGARTVFGPGTNGAALPGTTYGGSHGCVNVPTRAMAQFYEWTPTGTPVIVAP